MFSTRKEVDEQVHKLLGKLPPGPERDIKGLAVARLYIKIQQYNKSIEYLNSYLKVKDDAIAHKLIAYCYKMDKKKDPRKALYHYERCIQLGLGTKQRDVIKDACQLLLDNSSISTKEKIKYWCDLAENEQITDSPEIFSLRLKSATEDPNIRNEDNTDQTLEVLLHKEIHARPQDITARVRLLTHYVEKKRLEDAFKYAYNLEFQMDHDLATCEWYQALWLVVSKLDSTKDTKRDWSYWKLALVTLENLISLNLSDCNGSYSVIDATNFLFILDQYLYKYSVALGNLSGTSKNELQQYCLNHYTGQFLLHAVTLLFQRELRNKKNKWKDTLRNALPLLLLGFQLDTGKDLSNTWIKHCNVGDRKLLEKWRQETAFRCAQLGRTLFGCILERPVCEKYKADHLNWVEDNQPQGLWDNTDDILSLIRQTCFDRSWRLHIYQTLFTHSEQNLKDQSSAFVNYYRLQEPIYEWPNLAEIESFEEEALSLQPQSLQHHVYLSLCCRNLTERPRVKYYEDLKEDTNQVLSYCGADSLNKLDIDTFLYAVVIQARRKQQVLREKYDSNNEGSCSAAAKPLMLPFANMASQLASVDQSHWWKLVYKLYNSTDMICSRAEQRTQLQYGLEAVRGINGPRADILIVFLLGNLLAKRNQIHLQNIKDKLGLETRIESLYRQGFNMIRRQQAHQLEPFPRYFEYLNSNTTVVQEKLHKAVEEAISYFGRQYFKQQKYLQFIDEVRGLQLPMASFMQAEAYKQLEDNNKTTHISRLRYSNLRHECLKQAQKLLHSGLHPLSLIIQREMRGFNQNISISTPCLGVNDNDSSHVTTDVHNNSSAYEDAQDFNINATNRWTRDLDSAEQVYPSLAANNGLEKIVKQISDNLCAFREDACINIEAIKQEIITLTEKISTVEDLLKKCRFATNREIPTQEEDVTAAISLDDLFIIDEAVEQHQPATVLPQQTNMQGGLSTFGQLQGYLSGGKNTHHGGLQPPLANLYNSPLYNQPTTFNYYSQYMRTAQSSHNMPSVISSPNVFSQRNANLSNYGMPCVYPVTGPQFLESTLGTSPSAPSVSQQQTFLVSAAQQGETSAGTSTLNSLLLRDAKPNVLNNPPTEEKNPILQPKISKPAPSLTISTVFNRNLNNQLIEKELPCNVVITSSDPLPKPVPASTNVATVQPTLSVTIPPHHIKSNLVQPSEVLPTPLPSVKFSLNFIGSDINSDSCKNSVAQSLGESSVSVTSCNSSIPFSFKAQVAQAAVNKEKEDPKAFQIENDDIDFNKKSFCEDTTAELDYDPRPDFKGIIPLPAEIEVRTGEEHEEVMFCHRAKLFRHVDKEWKERGIGLIKILTNIQSGSSRVLMRREQTHKICANHKINIDTVLTTPEKDFEKKSFIWVANDFADEEMRLEKFLVRFKTPEIASNFDIVFNKCRLDVNKQDKNKHINFDMDQTEIHQQGAVSKCIVSEHFATSTPAHSISNDGLFHNNLQLPNSDGTTKNTTESIAVPVSLFNTPSNIIPTSDSRVSLPFANFSFGAPSAENNTDKNKCSLVGNIFTASETTSKGTIQPLTFGSSNVIADDDNTFQLNKSTSLDVEEDYVPTAQFAPAIPLPELVEVRTGEESENILFEHRAKLLRFDKETSEWKERGLGNIKLLQSKNDLNQVRLVMRREQVHKLCCNQRVSKNTKFSFSKNTTCAITWAGQDFSEAELSTELLCVRFKNSEISRNFLEVLHKTQKSMSESSEASREVFLNPQLPKIGSFGDAFKRKVGSWNCGTCYTENEAKQMHCLACQSAKDNPIEHRKEILGLEQAAPINLSNCGSKFSFGFSSDGTASKIDGQNKEICKISDSINTNTILTTGFGDAFKPKSGSWCCQTCYVNNDSQTLHCSACESPKDDLVPKKENGISSAVLQLPSTSKFSFGFNKTMNTKLDETKAVGDSVEMIRNISSVKPTLDFWSPKANSTTVVGRTPSILGSNTFSFTMTKPIVNKSLGVCEEQATLDDDFQEDEESTAYFAPVIPLPDKIDVKTGEEEEEALFVQRAKLYRLTEGEWKERGVGNVKILRHKQTQKLRIVMRREQVLKICLNHVLNPNVAYKVKDEKSWLFVVYDFSDGESVLERFTLRFKNSEISKAFHDAVKSALNGTAVAILEETLASNSLSPQTNESKKMLEKLKLPQDFFTVETKCLGCRGCTPDQFDFGKNLLPLTSNVSTKLPLMLPMLKLPELKVEPQNIYPKTSFGQMLIKPSTLHVKVSAEPTSFVSQTAFELSNVMDKNKSAKGPSKNFVFGTLETTPLFGKPANVQKPDHIEYSYVPTFGGMSKKLDTQSSKNGFDGTESTFGYNKDTGSISNSKVVPSLFINKEFTNIVGYTNSSANNCSFVFGSSDSKKQYSLVKEVNTNSLKDDKQKTSVDEIEVNTFDINAMNLDAVQKPNPSTFHKLKTNGSVKPDLKNRMNINPSADETAANRFADLAGDDFASLAAKNVGNVNAFRKSAADSYFGLTHQNAFKSFLQPDMNDSAKNKSLNSANSGLVDGDTVPEENYDPHYEPIIALPDEITIITGEENERKIFGERATLFRYDPDVKQWKERGVGELKILEHLELKTFRMVMRREQIHKLVLNMNIGNNLLVEFMNNSKKSFLWSHYNYAESSDGILERLACRFKKQEPADTFYEIICQCIKSAKSKDL